MTHDQHISRRWSGDWARKSAGPAPVVDVLVPTANRPAELAVTLAGLAAQDDPPFRITLSDQSEGSPDWAAPATAAMVRVLEAQGREVRLRRNLPRRGLAQQRDSLLQTATAPEVLFLDDDVWLEPGSLARLHRALGELECGFVGSAVQGLSFIDQVRPQERTTFELWSGPVLPEGIGRDSPAFARWPLHNAANLVHEASEYSLAPDDYLAYKVAWVGGCVLFDRQKLVTSGGFGFWRDLPVNHAGEDVVAQWRVMGMFGGAGILPSGAVHLESPTTVTDRDVEAIDLIASTTVDRSDF